MTSKRLTRQEAAAMLMGALKGIPVPGDYPGGWAKVMADFACLCPEYIRNLACQGRKSKHVSAANCDAKKT